MSTVKTTNLQHPSSGSANITLAADGSVVLPAGFTGGIGSNVVQTVKTDTFSTSSSSYTDVTDLEVTITPTSATSKVLLLADVKVSGPSGDLAALRFDGGNAGNYVGDAGTGTQTGGGGRITDGNQYYASTMVYLDSPATTSPVTYKVQMEQAGGGPVHVNRLHSLSGGDRDPLLASSLTAVEVAA